MHRANRRPTMLALLALSAGLAAASGVLVPEWSRPLPAPVLAATVGRLDSARDRVLLLLANRQVLAVSQTDTLRLLGTAPVGITALAAVPAGDPAALVLAGSKMVVAWDTAGRELWRSHLAGPLTVDSIIPADSRRPTADGRIVHRFCAWSQGQPWLVTATPGASAQRLDLGFLPSSGLITDADGDGAADFVAVGTGQLLVRSIDPGREFRLSWLAADGTWDTAHARPAAVFAADFDRDSSCELVLLDGGIPAGLHCVDGRTGREEWRLCLDTLPGPFTALAPAGDRIFAGGPGGRLAMLAADGSLLCSLCLPLGADARVTDLRMLGTWPLAVYRTLRGAESFLLAPCSPDPAARNSSGYSGVRIRRLLMPRIDSDTFPDIVVVRTAADVPLRLDLFRNDLGRLEHELARAHEELHAMGRRHDAAAARRAARRVELLSQQLNRGESRSRAEEELQRRLRREADRGRATRVVVVIAVAALLFSAGILTNRFRRRQDPGLRLEDKPLAVRTALAVDLVAMDHNFITKGNQRSALERFRELRERYQLTRDPGLAGFDDRLQPYYTDTIERLINRTPTEHVLGLLEPAAKSTDRPVETVSMTREEFRRLAREPGFRIVLVRNREYPGIYSRLRVFSNPEARAALEHFVIDHFRYARTRAAIVLDYVVNTQWNRKLLVTFFSDSEETIDFAGRGGHLVSQLAELAAAMRPTLEVPGPDYERLDPDERLWLRFTDLVSVLEETKQRLLQPGPGGAT